MGLPKVKETILTPCHVTEDTFKNKNRVQYLSTQVCVCVVAFGRLSTPHQAPFLYSPVALQVLTSSTYEGRDSEACGAVYEATDRDAGNCWFVGLGSFIVSTSLESGYPLWPLATTSGSVQARDSIVFPRAGWQGKASHGISY